MANEIEKLFFDAVGRHFVTLSYVYTPPGMSSADERTGIISGFIVEIEGAWFYMTAGHVIDEIREGLKIGGKFDVWRFGDQTAGNVFKGIPVPYDFNIDNWLVLRDDNIGLDYAVVVLAGLYRQNLEAGGVVPIARKAWGTYVDSGHNQWILVGIPAETVEYRQRRFLTARVVMVPLEPAQEPPSAGDKIQNKFFGKLKFDSANTKTPQSIEGMSGGPIFATRKSRKNLKYWVIGVQSGWYPSTSTISACPFSSLAVSLEKLMREVKLKGARSNSS